MKEDMPTAFISYSWDNEPHKEWVRDLATRLRSDGVNVTLDQWHSIPGDQLPEFMEKSIRENNYVLIICTQNYKRKSDSREGGVGYEGDIITAELFTKGNNRKFIPILRGKDWSTCAPTWLLGKYYISLNEDPYPENEYHDLLVTVFGVREKAPPIGPPPDEIRTKIQRRKLRDKSPSMSSSDHVQIMGILADEVTTPSMDGSPGSALYTIPIKLSSSPSSKWVDVFIQIWNNPPRFSTMHRPGIARVSGNQIILDGTTIEEVRDYHRDTLVLCVDKANEIVEELRNNDQKAKELEQKREQNHKSKINDLSDDIDF
jgi:hypothetical protein